MPTIDKQVKSWTDQLERRVVEFNENTQRTGPLNVCRGQKVLLPHNQKALKNLQLGAHQGQLFFTTYGIASFPMICTKMTTMPFYITFNGNLGFPI